MDLVHGAVDCTGLVHRGLAAIVACPSSSELGLRPLRLSGLPDEGWRRERGARGPGSDSPRLVSSGVVAHQRGEPWCGSLGARKWGKEERGRSDGRRGCLGALYRVRGGAGRSGIGGE
jgi:hypothetical protein